MTYRTFATALPVSVRADLNRAGRKETYRRGDALVEQDVAGNDVMLIIDGWVKVVSAAANGAEVILALRGPGDLIGELPAFDGGRRSATVRALGPVRVRIIPGPLFRAHASRSPELALAIIDHLAYRLRESDTRRLEAAATTT